VIYHNHYIILVPLSLFVNKNNEIQTKNKWNKQLPRENKKVLKQTKQQSTSTRLGLENLDR